MMKTDKAYLVMDDYLMETELIHKCSPCIYGASLKKCPDNKIKFTRLLWLDSDRNEIELVRPRLGSWINGPVVFNDDPSNPKNCITRFLDIALQKLQLKFDHKASDARDKVKSFLKDAEKYSTMNAKKLVLDTDVVIATSELDAQLTINAALVTHQKH